VLKSLVAGKVVNHTVIDAEAAAWAPVAPQRMFDYP
jgi:hypothetical protein